MKKTRSAGGVVLNKKGEVLLVHQNGHSWSLPKGHIAAGEEALSAAQREIHEESGIRQLAFLKPLGRYQRYKIGLKTKEDKTELKTIEVFLFTTDERALRPLDPDTLEARWVERHKVASLLTHPRDAEFFCGILSQLPPEPFTK